MVEVPNTTQQTNSPSFAVHNDKKKDVRRENIVAARGVADAIRTSLGPRGMDKMIQDGKGHTIVTNDGATILKGMSVMHPTARMLVELSKSQDVEAGDGTTSVVILCGGLLRAAEELLEKGIHPQIITRGFQKAAGKAKEFLQDIAISVDMNDRDAMIRVAQVALASKVVSSSAPLLAPIAVDACIRLRKKSRGNYLDLKNIRIVKLLGGTVDETTLVEGLVFTNRKLNRIAAANLTNETSNNANNDNSGMTQNNDNQKINQNEAVGQFGVVETRGRSALVKIQNAKIGLIQFCISSPKTDMDNSISITSYGQMDRLLRQEKLHIAKYVQTITKTGCNVLIIQKSILRDAVTDLALDFLAKSRIVVIRDIERDDMDYIAHQLGCEPIASIDYFTSDRLATAGLVVEEDVGGGARIIKITGLHTNHASTVFLRASNEQLLDEAERSLHDALCVVRCLFKKPFCVTGGGGTEMQLAYKLSNWAKAIEGSDQIVIEAFADALSVIPYSLAENANLPPLETVAELRAEYANNANAIGIDARKGRVTDMLTQGIIQPLVVTESVIALATECANMILKIDDIIGCR